MDNNVLLQNTTRKGCYNITFIQRPIESAAQWLKGDLQST